MSTIALQANSDEARGASFLDESTGAASGTSAAPVSGSTFSFSGFRAPDTDRNLQMHETKALARAIIKKRFTEGEWQTLLTERQQLLDKQFSGAMTQSDKNRLAYVRWSLDQIEDAKHGATLDVLESAVGRYENFLEGVRQLNQDLVRNAANPRKR